MCLQRDYPILFKTENQRSTLACPWERRRSILTHDHSLCADELLGIVSNRSSSSLDVDTHTECTANIAVQVSSMRLYCWLLNYLINIVVWHSISFIKLSHNSLTPLHRFFSCTVAPISLMVVPFRDAVKLLGVTPGLEKTQVFWKFLKVF